MKNILLSLLRVKLILACREVLNESGLINQNRLLFIQFQTLPPSMHHYKWKESIDSVSKTTNEIL
jgi:hypothetical protein